jgi:hypothetical protein
MKSDKQRWAATSRRSPKTLSPVSRCRISSDGVSEAYSSGRLCTQSTERGILEEDRKKRNLVASERQKRVEDSNICCVSCFLVYCWRGTAEQTATSWKTETRAECANVPNSVVIPTKVLAFHNTGIELDLGLDSRNMTRRTVVRRGGWQRRGAHELLLFSLTWWSYSYYHYKLLQLSPN